MVQRLKPHDVKLITKDGELQISITLELNINLNADGLKVSATANTGIESKEEDPMWEIPDFSSKKIKFGKSD